MATAAPSAAASSPPPAPAPSDEPCACVAPPLSWIQTVPKVEMHAHLSGSVKDSTIRAMLREEAQAAGTAADAVAALSEPSCLSTFISGERTLSQCFEVFSLLHRLLSTLPAVTRVTREVIADFAADEVVYLELRTTPRALGGASKRDYVQTVVDAIRECDETVRTPSGERILVRLLLSIDRSGSQSDAESTVSLAGEFHAQPDPVVVGVDFSGNPTVSSFRAFEHHFLRARTLGLKSSVHVGEKVGDGDDLDAVLLRFRPERIGHVVCLEERHTAALLERPIPIEICPTSNVMTRIVRSLEHHPFGTWRAAAAGARNHNSNDGSNDNGDGSVSSEETLESSPSLPPYPLIICTDDSGVFNVTLSSEIHRLAVAFHMDRGDILQLEADALEHGFVAESHKRNLRDIFRRFKDWMVEEDNAAATAAAAAATAPAAAAATQTAAAACDPRPIAILTCAEELGSNPGDLALIAAFRARGRSAVHLVWNAPVADWTAYRGVVVRSIWDYHLSPENLAGLFRVLGGIEAAGVPLLNSLETLRWNHSKAYLRELASLGVGTVDSMWVESLPDEQDQLASRLAEKGWNECVLKPQVSASGNLTFRFALHPHALPGPALPSLDQVLARCAPSGVQRWLVQAFCAEVLSEGEWSFVFLNGEYSHCVLSTPAGSCAPQAGPAWLDPDAPVLPGPSRDAAAVAAATHANSFMVQQTHGGSFRYREPGAALIEQARSILHSTRYGRESLYARVDCIRRGDKLLLSELELIEPELFGRGVEGFQRKFVDAIEKRLAQAATR